MEEKKQVDPKKIKKRRKKLLTGFFFLAIFIMMLVYAQEQAYHRAPSLKQADFNFAYGVTIPTNSAFYLRYGQAYEDVEFETEKFQFEEIGDYEVSVSFANQEFVLQIHIIDQQPPRITFIDEDKTIAYRYKGQLYFDRLFEVDEESEYTYSLTTKDVPEDERYQEICVHAEDAHQNESNICKNFQLDYIDLKEFENETEYASVEELVQAFIQEKKLNEKTFGFYFASFHDQEEYIYNKDHIFNAASIIKLPMNMLYYDGFLNGSRKREETITLLKQDIEPGGGFTSTKHKVNEKVSVPYLLEQSIVYSDNTATNMLVRNLGGFYQFRKQLDQYAAGKMPKDFYYQNVVTMEYMLNVMKQLYHEQDRYKELIEHMKQASEKEFLKQSTDLFMIAQKYGAFEKNLHATGIVYTPDPYIVGIYTYDRVDALDIMKELNTRLIAYQLYKNLEITELQDPK